MVMTRRVLVGLWVVAALFGGAARTTRAADEKPLAGSFRTSFRTPPFMRTMLRSGSEDADEPSAPMPKVALVYNLAVDLTKAEASEKIDELQDKTGRGAGQKTSTRKRRG